MSKPVLQKNISKYLAAHAEQDITSLSLPAFPAVQDICIVPVFDEEYEQIASALRHVFCRATALIWVFNCPDNADQNALARTQNCLAQVRSKLNLHQEGPQLQWAQVSDNLQLWLLDYTKPGHTLPAKQGVGLARKLGMDLAISLCAKQLEQGEVLPSWLHSCDADVQWPEQYMNIPAPASGQVASLYPFRHQPDAGWEQAMQLYDLRLDYYVGLLQRAGSPYAFHTLGSVIAVTPLAYTQVRGMPKRSGGEDFYLLNKLAKLGRIDSLKAPELILAGRPSVRVPFGTGPALRSIKELESPVAEYRLYHPLAIERLRVLLAAVEDYSSTNREDKDPNGLFDILDGKHSPAIIEVLEALGFERFRAHCMGQKHQQAFSQLFHIWFDGFQTLKFVHAMRDLDCPDLTLAEILAYKDLLSPQLVARINAMLSEV